LQKRCALEAMARLSALRVIGFLSYLRRHVFALERWRTSPTNFIAHQGDAPDENRATHRSV
jgi:hypothetical protein